MVFRGKAKKRILHKLLKDLLSINPDGFTIDNLLRMAARKEEFKTITRGAVQVGLREMVNNRIIERNRGPNSIILYSLRKFPYGEKPVSIVDPFPVDTKPKLSNVKVKSIAQYVDLHIRVHIDVIH